MNKPLVEYLILVNKHVHVYTTFKDLSQNTRVKYCFKQQSLFLDESDGNVLTGHDLICEEDITLDLDVEVNLASFVHHLDTPDIGSPEEELTHWDESQTVEALDNYNDNIMLDVQHDQGKIKELDITGKEDIQFYLNNDTVLLKDIAFRLSKLFDISVRDIYTGLECPPDGIRWVNLDKCKSIWLGQIKKQAKVNVKMITDEIEQYDDQEIRDEMGLIRTMIQNVPEEVDLSSVKTLQELVTYWPHLLLPGPEFVVSSIPVVEEVLRHEIK